MAIQKTQSYLLRKIPLRETSWILTCLTRSFGKLKGVVKGARKEKSTWFSACEPFTLANMVFYEKPKTGLHLITELAVLQPHERLRRNLPALTYAGYFAELIDQLLEENEPQPDVFDLFRAAIDQLEKNNAASFDILARVFELKLLQALGLLPRFSECLGCGSEVSGKIYFSAKQGGILCEKCHGKSHGGFLISKGCVPAVQYLTASIIEKAAQLKLGKQIKMEIEQLTRQFIEFRAEKQLKSLYFLAQVKPVICGMKLVSTYK